MKDNEWKRTALYLPPAMFDVLIWTRANDGVTIGYIDSATNKWMFADEKEEIKSPVTHWMFLPEPPTK